MYPYVAYVPVCRLHLAVTAQHSLAGLESFDPRRRRRIRTPDTRPDTPADAPAMGGAADTPPIAVAPPIAGREQHRSNKRSWPHTDRCHTICYETYWATASPESSAFRESSALHVKAPRFDLRRPHTDRCHRRRWATTPGVRIYPAPPYPAYRHSGDGRRPCMRMCSYACVCDVMRLHFCTCIQARI
jgi:hypothetical protein